MKKFTKGCLLTALILFIFGFAFWGVCGYMGGFRQLDDLNLRHNRILSLGWNGFHFGYNGNWFDIWDDDFGDFAVYVGDDERQGASGTPSLVDIGEKVQTGYQASEVTDIDIELGGSNLFIRESEDDYIWVANDSTAKTVKYHLKNGVFKLYYGRNVRFWSDISQNGNICLYLPKGMRLGSIDLEMGAGNMESIALAADEIDMEIGAGNFTIDGLTGNEISINVGAGKADIGSINAREIYAAAGAGEITVNELISDELDLEVGMGNMNIRGSVNWNADVECGMGNVNLTLQGVESDYNYELECALGNIMIGKNRYSGIVERTIDNGSSRRIGVECATGNINITFEK